MTVLRRVGAAVAAAAIGLYASTLAAQSFPSTKSGEYVAKDFETTGMAKFWAKRVGEFPTSAPERSM